VENVGELINAASKYDEAADHPSLIDYLQTIALYSDTDAFDPDSGKVSLMTLHAAKGLEFQVVFLVGLEEGILPHERSLAGGDDLEEERRLFFVGITRAKDLLTITMAQHRVVRGQFLRCTPSQFLYEIGFSAEDADRSWQDNYTSGYDPYGASSGRIKDIPEPDPYTLNELVQHKKFGLGRVKEYTDLGEDSFVIVRFNSGQIKTLMLKYAKLERVQG
jgi:DNA helicase-2/ATP-dependent DNA helicase PcrA